LGKADFARSNMAFFSGSLSKCPSKLIILPFGKLSSILSIINSDKFGVSTLFFSFYFSSSISKLTKDLQKNVNLQLKT